MKMIKPSNEEILEGEYLRPQPAGIRAFSVGILGLCRKLGMNIARKKEDQEARDGQREMVVLAFLLDERHTIEQIRAKAALGPAWVDSEELDEYEFAIEPQMLRRVQVEIERTNAALSALAFTVEKKPRASGAADEASPVGKS